MNNPHTNYLKNTAPQSREDFINLLGQTSLFAGLPKELRSRIFDYAKFMDLGNGERPVVEGMFDQEIYLLIKGRLDVFIKLENKKEKQIDSLGESFTLFGERCLLGQPRGASIQSNGESLLLGLDLSSLPDLNEHLEDPSVRLEDSAYQDNLDMYLVVASVLYGRLERLVHDQYKLANRIRGMKKGIRVKKHNVLMTQLYNELVENRLAVELRSPEIWRRLLRNLKSEVLDRLLEEEVLNTARIYEELVRLQALGLLQQRDWVYDLLKRLTEQAKFLKRYYEPLQVDSNGLPEVMELAQCLEDLHLNVEKAGILTRSIHFSEFLEALDDQGRWNPSGLVKHLGEVGLLTSWFGRAHLALVLCSALISLMGKANQVIASYVSFLGNLHTQPRQFPKQTGEDLASLFETFYQSLQKSPGPEAALEAVEPSVDSLLAQFGM
ncbi:MAG: hypothetical protein A2600_08760 [Candidatus Lambdaproteobacteria bacterium RIFOXYD1_FULL_56_27]|uniref:Cyclic nucleotide-binding domain-containing protein n=1 Tax=Candidatus Lambdaproteobacteria bacterium RIFOXYD2_FULL_56_26 TaxID=1817773 RepID=A0A1F6GZA3_9PROT|nr:MAG: hypothetical protein A2426_10180 [Candidatus Lambdaproteobacteria bacterium RIFOXYC1_FULL_56_13]OGH03374.1 MAG: hypothetical protein A2557_02505 [Candidatus Lambdaproteobacteria bacterium RIFOXYD2_FULL_56_26]OGH06621.1 MAG: hypothetical protein A2600_08760 [Candidatus Lambdaproteobacteria bacterium RIFOXYD1_FULL_56_27]